ncbi:dehydratase [Aureimonas sp. Leaf454]|uniref:NAD-dependent epimerase/dehydratase family protein n=1 Tax=Aureimonas sp. Leaf454 TaxID=1736381 RepID=UPI0006F6A7B4|nr:SDR family NAD(P)-dependent oxidoreductase [Aureimonas sp. Leaf454]KQT53771.1 dehydratase [Aureimonas sp. Leaf454]
MGETVLVTGGAGFVGRHVAKELLSRGHRVRALDLMIDQVHSGSTRPDELDPEVDLVVGDIRDAARVQAALQGVDSVIHLAAEVGVGQSMYAVDRYTSVNEYGTAVLFQQLIEKPVRRVVVASSMSIYGEGLYRTVDGGLREDVVRGPRHADGSFDPRDEAGRALIPIPTPETKQPALKSVYAINKFVQERLTLTLTAQYGMEGTALRLWNIYGTGQALSNPYTGVLAIFASRIANGQRPMVFEDGQQRRDFVHVADVARAFLLALESPAANGEVFNVGSGADRTVEAVARLQAASMGRPDIAPDITGKARAGDIRHNIPDLGKAKALLGYEARQDFAAGLEELSEWVARQEANDRVDEARRELERRGLVA